MAHTILLVDSDTAATELLERALRQQGHRVESATSGADALEKLDAKIYDVAIIDIDVLPPVNAPPRYGFAVLQHAMRKNRARHAIVMATDGTVPSAVAAIRAGASDFLVKPLNPQALTQAVDSVLGGGRELEPLQAWRQRYAPNFIGDDPKIIAILTAIQRIAPSECDVLITGASGTGKELIARCIHMASKRQSGPFVALNCAAIPRDLMESELFGHSRGAFTGAVGRRCGKFEAADGGTLFLDEAGELELSLQGKFLRVLQEREITPIGDARAMPVNVRIVSATNQALETLCRERLFREDLYYRLNVIPVHLPALAERPHDIPILAAHFVERANRRHSRCVRGVDEGALERFSQHSWPGNIRELQNLIERLVVMKADDSPVSINDLPITIAAAPSITRIEDLRLPENGMDINEALTLVETRLTVDALQRACGNKAKAAELLGLKRTTLVERLKKLNLDVAI